MTATVGAAVRYELRNGVAWLTINRPDARNALDREVREGLFAGVHRFNGDVDAAVLVLTGAGDKAFCAGGDLKEMVDDALAVPPPDFLPQFGAITEVKVGRGAPWAAPLPWLIPPQSRCRCC
jgi:enoyl-CoA hydratase/carnithine racemase